MIFYHITRYKNLKSILKEGLKIEKSWRFNCLFFVNSLKLSREWLKELKDTYNIKEKQVIIKLDIRKKDIYKAKGLLEFLSYKNITKDKIKGIIK